ncbi:hypothetical protein I6E26_03755 [Anaerovibrio lipolyticus]|uniref:hypothetical protein n=1 Tax=Anaerovibrio lipolyticus TaxID=82374 RepID=UPI001F344F6F|nr:hypothetical protein [Anaerovibrio lipolyticus]MCF2600672.1 hypothetical protein [Anaerovibrio lipolyticus]
MEENRKIGVFRMFSGVRLLENISQGYYNITIDRNKKQITLKTFCRGLGLIFGLQDAG